MYNLININIQINELLNALHIHRKLTLIICLSESLTFIFSIILPYKSIY